MIYLDNAATSFPKPPEAVEGLNNFVLHVGGNPGRSGHRASVDAARIIFEAREHLTAFIGGNDSRRLIFTQNGTESLNLALIGLLREGDHIITSSMEHNSVMRPLSFLSRARGVEVTAVPCDPSGLLDPDDLRKARRMHTRAVVINHGSNVTGTLQPLREIRQALPDVLCIVDACQTVGSHPINAERDGIDALCFSCHKALFSIQGLGALYLREGLQPSPLKYGGTGSGSEFTEQPEFLPDRYESGTPNTPGIASLLGGLAFIRKTGLEQIIERKSALRRRLREGLSAIEGVHILGPVATASTAILSITVDGKLPSEVGYELDRRGIYVRVGLHCSPVAHRSIGTFPQGTVRLAPGFFTSDSDIETVIEALRGIAQR